MKRKIVAAALVILSGAILICSCTKGYNTSGTSAPMPMGNGSNMMMGTVMIQNMAFMPDTIRVTMGTMVMWSNMDGVAHTVTDEGGMFDSGSIAAGMSYQYTFAYSGTYTYNSTINPIMKPGVVIVSSN